MLNRICVVGLLFLVAVATGCDPQREHLIQSTRYAKKTLSIDFKIVEPEGEADAKELHLKAIVTNKGDKDIESLRLRFKLTGGALLPDPKIVDVLKDGEIITAGGGTKELVVVFTQIVRMGKSQDYLASAGVVEASTVRTK